MEVYAVTVFRADSYTSKTLQLYKKKKDAQEHADRLNEMYQQDSNRVIHASVEVMKVK